MATQYPRPGGITRARYRVRQFLNAATARIRPEERAAVAALLPPAALALFDRMPRDAQRHSLNVMQSLQGMGVRDPELLTAALLHDVGKVAADDAGVRINLWLRGPLVLAEALTSRQVTRYASDNPADGWRYALHVHLAHPAIGAAWLDAAGLSPRICWLVAHHQATDVDAPDPDAADLLAALQWADGIN